MAAKWLKKLGKIASVAAPIIAAPFTGGTSLALIGAGAGALGGLASGGGLKGALLGAGMGAIPVPGAAGSAKALGLTTTDYAALTARADLVKIATLSGDDGRIATVVLVRTRDPEAALEFLRELTDEEVEKLETALRAVWGRAGAALMPVRIAQQIRPRRN